MRGSIWVVALVVAACGSKSTPGGVDAPVDGPAAPKVVACGTSTAPTSCPLPGMECCYFTPGTGSDYCYAVQGGNCEGGAPIGCDGPEDCSNGDICCYVEGTGSSCVAGPTCSGGAIMCHIGDDSPCEANAHCCLLYSGGPSMSSTFGVCQTGVCQI